MELNWLERIFVNSPIRLIMQSLEMRWFCRKLPPNTVGNILEIGCGRGAGAGLILEKFNPSGLYLSDLDIRMLRSARMYLGDKGRAKVHLCQSDAADLPFGNRRFDAVFGFGFLHHVLQWRKGLAEVGRVLKTGGAYYLVEFYPKLYQNVITKHMVVHPESDRFKSSDLKDALRELGLGLAHCFELNGMGIIGIGIKK
jgi:ubiquinone/menaquinone biosynthesis C-methylase UbiE